MIILSLSSLQCFIITSEYSTITYEETTVPTHYRKKKKNRFAEFVIVINKIDCGLLCTDKHIFTFLEHYTLADQGFELRNSWCRAGVIATVIQQHLGK